jgi:hypothetical protein
LRVREGQAARIELDFNAPTPRVAGHGLVVAYSQVLGATSRRLLRHLEEAGT